MDRIAKFSKVSFGQFKSDWEELFNNNGYQWQEEEIKQIYDSIKIPERKTSGSAGYDFYAPIGFELPPNGYITFPTGIRCEMNDDWCLQIFPRSSLGFKYKMTIANTVGIIDSDYFYADNEGHIMMQIVNRGDRPIPLREGERFVQGIFMRYGITDNDSAEATRTGGIGSTDNT